MKSRPNNDDVVLIDAYLGAYGPTIRIAVQSLQRLSEVKEWFLQLAQGARQEIDLVQFDMVRPTGLRSLTLKLIPDSERIKKKMVAVNKERDEARFLWSGHSDDWLTCAGLVEGLVEGSGSGHQYMTTEGVDDALIELSYAE